MQRPTEILERLRAMLSEGRVRFLVILGIAGIALILVSGSFSRKETDSTEESVSLSVACAQDYARDAERRLQLVLSSVNGVGKTEIMINVECTEELVYAEDTDESKKSAQDGFSSDRNAEHVILKNGSSSSALVKKIVCPRLSGVLIACEGGDNIAVKDAVTRSVSALFGISSAKVYVAKLKQ